MKAQFGEQINTHQPRDWSKYSVYLNAIIEVTSGDCTRAYTLKYHMP